MTGPRSGEAAAHQEILEGLDLSRQLTDLAVDDQNADRPDKRDQQREHLKDDRERAVRSMSATYPVPGRAATLFALLVSDGTGAGGAPAAERRSRS